MAAPFPCSASALKQATLMVFGIGASLALPLTISSRYRYFVLWGFANSPRGAS